MSSTTELTPLQKAALAIKELRARLDAAEAARNEPLAITGLACRFPGARDSDAYWALLSEGRDAIGEVPPSRWDLTSYFDPNPNAAGKINTRYGGFLDEVDGFDAAFFGIAPQEAEHMDPQQRLFLQTAWHALEDAGVPPGSLRGSRTGVFVGITQTDYGMMQLAGPDSGIQAYTGTGNGFCFAAGRLSFTLGLHGPSFAVDTACSSSLVALHQASLSLRAGECDTAIVAGLQLNLAPQMQIFLARTQSFAPDGRCRSFDASANGFVLSEGIGVIVLRRLSDARRSGQHIRAVIRGSSVNHGGAASGLTVPNELAQEQVIRDALQNAKLSPDDIDYIEAHGSATELGDPIEVGALRSVFGGRPAEQPLWLGAVKSNLGHLSAAAGMAGLIKTVLMLEHQHIAPNLHFVAPSPRIDWDGFAVRVPTELTPWRHGDRRRRAGVSAFGLSGSNAHIVLEEAPDVDFPAAEAAERPLHLLALSARSPTALTALARSYSELGPSLALADICHAANTGRTHLAVRLAVVAETRADLTRQLEAYVAGRMPDLAATARRGGPGPLVWSFGNGITPGDVRQLAHSVPAVAAVLARCDALKPSGAEAEQLAAMLALSALWRVWGLQPDGVTGQGVGLVAARHAAGEIEVEEAFRILAGEPLTGRPARVLRHEPGLLPQGAVILDIGAASWPALVARVADLYRSGYSIDWAGFDAGHVRRHVRLPGYPFEERRFWLEIAADEPAVQGSAKQALGEPVPAAEPAFMARQRAIAEAALSRIAQLQGAFLAQREQAGVVPPEAGGAPFPPESLGSWSLLALAGTSDAERDALMRAPRETLSGTIGRGTSRAILVHEGRDDAREALAGQKRVIKATARPGRSLVFMFPGVGDHYIGMARGLYDSAPAFRAEVDLCAGVLAPLLGCDIREVIWPVASATAETPTAPASGGLDLRAMLGRGAAPANPADELLNRTINSQPALFVIEYALGRLWRSFGIIPDAMIGYSIGEYAAACLSGVIGLEDALRLVARRAQLIDMMTAGVLLAVPLAESRLQPLLGPELSIALISTPSMCVVGGPDAAILALEQRLKAEEIVSRRLPGTHAFHTHMLAPLHREVADLVAGFRLSPPRIPYVSNVTGTWITAGQAADPEYWARHTWTTVRFADGVATLLADEGRVFLEAGPGQSLGSFVLQHPAAQKAKDKLVLASLRNRYERQPDEAHFLATAGKLWLAGIIDQPPPDGQPTGEK